MSYFASTEIGTSAAAVAVLDDFVRASLALGWTVDSDRECHSWATGTEIWDGADLDDVVWKWVVWPESERANRLQALFEVIRKNQQGGIRLFAESITIQVRVFRQSCYSLGIKWNCQWELSSGMFVVPKLDALGQALDDILRRAAVQPLWVQWDYGHDFE